MIFLIVLAAIVWFGLGYIAARACILDFRNNFGEGSESGALAVSVFLLGLAGYATAFVCADREALYEAHFMEVPPKPDKDSKNLSVNKFFGVK